jgi:hypothetical protein
VIRSYKLQVELQLVFSVASEGATAIFSVASTHATKKKKSHR